MIRGNTAVKLVTFDDETSKFTVRSRNMDREQNESSEEFDYVINAAGFFHDPNMPYVEGFENFRGRLMHSHDVKNAEEFKDLRICVVGTHYSGEDIASMAWKNGAKSVCCSYRTKPMSYEWPENFSTRPLIQKVEGNTATFLDGSTEELDVIIMCTGYTHNNPFMEDKLRLNTPTKLYMNNMFKSCIWQKNPKLMYLGMVDQMYTLTMFDS